MGIKTDFLIIGAGPFGLSMAAYAKHLNIDYKIIGRTMEFWKNNMPSGMQLRSGPDWHIDSLGENTLVKFLKTKNISPDKISPIPINLYLEYTDWFRKEKQIEPIQEYITKLDYNSDNKHRFMAYLSNKEVLEAHFVLVAIGFGYFKNIPQELSSSLPNSYYSHSADLIDFSKLKSKNCIIVGGRQSAFESALLIKKAGGKKIHIVHRHKTPDFTHSDWDFVTPILDKMIDDHDYYLKLSDLEKKEINDRFWQEGRLKLEPWLKELDQYEDIDVYEQTNVCSAHITKDGNIEAMLSNGTNLKADHLLFATGYKVDLQRVPFLKNGNILDKLATNNGFPKLRSKFQSVLTGLYFTSLPATADFGAFFGFTVSCNTSSIIIGNEIKNISS